MYKISKGIDGHGFEKIISIRQGLRALTQYNKNYHLYYRENLDSKWVLIK